MPTTAIQFTPQIFLTDLPVAGNVSATAFAATPQPVLTMTPPVSLNFAPITPDALVLDSLPANGVASVAGHSLTYQANPGYAGPDVFTFHAVYGGHASNVATATISMVENCNEIGNATKILAGAWDRVRMFGARLIRGERRCLLVDFNGAIPANRTIVSAKWQCALPYIAFMANARIFPDRRSTAVDLTANYPNVTDFKCTATLDNGEEYVQLIRVEVDDTYWFSADTIATVGPTVLVAT